MQKTIEVVAAIIECSGKILLAQRSSGSELSGYWEFPGGKVETGETQSEALRRELREELSIDAQIGDYIASSELALSEKHIVLHAWQVQAFTGELTLHRCHAQLAWVTPKQAFHYPLAPADIPLLEAYIAQKSL